MRVPVPVRVDNKELVKVSNLSMHFPIKRTLAEQIMDKEKKFVHAVDDVNLTIKKGEILGLVGESGCGKSTLGRTILRLYYPTRGKVIFDGLDITEIEEKKLRSLRHRMQIIFQNPYTSLNPRKTVRQILGQAIKRSMTKKDTKDETNRIIDLIGLDKRHLALYPHQFSGGQRQRIGIARALALDPDFIVADEPVASLDVSIQAQILKLIKELQSKFSLTLLFISHDINVVSYLSHTIAVMYLGNIVETGPSQDLVKNPLHPYTRALLSAVPLIKKLKKKKVSIEGEIPSAINPPSGCRFNTRCYLDKKDICYKEQPELKDAGNGRKTACHLI